MLSGKLKHPNSGPKGGVLHIGKYFPPHRGGMETILRDQVEMEIRSKGLRTSVVVHSTKQSLFDSVVTMKSGYRVRYAARWFTLIFAPIAPFFAISLQKEIKLLQPDIIRIHVPNLSAFWLFVTPAAWTRQWEIVWHSDVIPSKYSVGLRLFYYFYRPFELLLLTRAHRIIATSQDYLDSSIPLMPFKHKCHVEALEIDSERIPIALRTSAQPKKDIGEGLRILCVGRLTYYKDFGTAIRAAFRLPDAQLRIVGDGTERASLEMLVKELDLSHRVTFFGECSDDELWSHYAWADALCLPSIERTEAFGLTVNEAAAFSKPSVVSDLDGSGLPWNARRSHPLSRVFIPGNADSLADALKALNRSMLS